MKKQITATVLAAILAAGVPGTALAAVGPSGVDTTQSGSSNGSPAGTSEETAAKAAALADNKLEYGELGDLIETYNVTYKNTKSQAVTSVQDLDSARALREQASEVMIDAADLKSDGLSEATKEVYEGYRTLAKELRKQASQIENTDLSASAQRQLRKLKVNLTYTAQQLMIAYEQKSVNQELMDKSRELAAASLESTRLQASSLGMKTREDVQASEEAYKQAEEKFVQFQYQLQNVKQDLLMVTGWTHDAGAEICPLPAPDLSRIDGMNPQNDLQAAIGANYDLQDLRNGSAVGSSNRGVKKRNVSQSEQELASTLQSLYANVISARQSYEGEQAAFEAATQIMSGEDLKHSMGMTGKLDYINAQITYLTAKQSYEAAKLQLFSAMENYDWAVKGFVAPSGGGM